MPKYRIHNDPVFLRHIPSSR